MAFLGICAILRNEGPYVYEWLSFHRYVGVEKFLLYDNDSDDQTFQIVGEWSERFGGVESVIWPGHQSQVSAYQHAIDNYRGFAEWCAFIDGDEFLVPTGSMSIEETLRYFSPLCSGLYVHWLMFGSSGLKKQWPGLVTEVFRRRGRAGFGPNSIGKMIVRMAAAQKVLSAHRITVRGRSINDEEIPVPDRADLHPVPPSHMHLAINHYYTKSKEEWDSRRVLGRVSRHPDDAEFLRTADDFARHDRNDVFDNKAADIMSCAREHFYFNRKGSRWTQRTFAAQSDSQNSKESVRHEFNMTATGNGGEITTSGFARPENTGVWTSGKLSQITLPPVRSPNLALEIELTPFVPRNFIEGQCIEILARGTLVYSAVLDRRTVIRFRIPDDPVVGSDDRSIELRMPDAISPSALGVSPDVRRLGFFLHRIVLHQRGEVVPEFVTDDQSREGA